jgi:ribosomal protein L29
MQNTNKSLKEFQDKIVELRKQIFELRFTKPESRPKDFATQMRKARKGIAQMMKSKGEARK